MRTRLIVGGAVVLLLVLVGAVVAITRSSGDDLTVYTARSHYGEEKPFEDFTAKTGQDIELFGGTVRENIARLQDAPSEDVIAAATMVGLHETIMRLPRGYETDIGEGGMRLSGGQRQRLGLARAFFGYPQLVVLDEPNASLDPEGEEALRQAILEMRDRGSTIIIIAQRLGILNLSDKVLVLDSGMINAFGKRRDIAEKIRTGRTVIPVRNPQITARKSTKPSVEINSPEAPQATIAEGVAEEETQRAVS